MDGLAREENMIFWTHGACHLGAWGMPSWCRGGMLVGYFGALVAALGASVASFGAPWLPSGVPAWCTAYLECQMGDFLVPVAPLKQGFGMVNSVVSCYSGIVLPCCQNRRF